MLIYTSEAAEAAMQPDDMKSLMNAYHGFTSEAREKRALLGGNALQPTATATTIQVREGKTVTTDGPYAETKEQLGGYYLLDCGNLDEALEYAAKIPGAAYGSIEIRPVMVFQ
jgi:hypothetical protein